MPSQPAPPAGPQLEYVDRPEVSETFADSLERFTIDQTGARLEFVVHRSDQPSPPAPLIVKKYTACRVVMPLQGFFAMVTMLNELVQQMQKQGLIKPVTPTPSSGKPH